MKKKVILIADDRAEMRQLLRLTLSSRGIDVLEAECGRDAARMTKAMRPACVIMDAMMPGETDGYQACRKIKDDPQTRDIPVIMVTARGQASDVEEGQKAGANAYVVKPFSPLQLLEMVDKYVPPRAESLVH